MYAKTLAALLTLLVAVGSPHGSVVGVFCSESGDRGLARDVTSACAEADCHDAPRAGARCADEDCCTFEQYPAHPIASNAGGTTFGEDTTVAVGPSTAGRGLDHPRDSLGGRPHRLVRSGPDTGAFAGYRLPLLS